MDGAHHSEPYLVVLHTLRCCGAASTDRIAATVAPLVAIDAEAVLLDLAAQGLVANSGGVFGGWRLTDAGRDVDGAQIARLAAVNAEAQPVCARLGARLHRFSHYGPRLSAALDRGRRGQLEQVTDSLDSYHTLWVQLHEDLLATLGLSREM